ncbi:MAG: nucleotide exchange factor GrpE [Acidobacteriota bacterium]
MKAEPCPSPERATETPGERDPAPRAHKNPVSVVDRRRVGREEDGTVEVGAAEPNLKPTYVEELEGRVARAEARLKERLAELEEEARRSRERVALDLERRFADREKATLLDILDIMDDLDRAAALAADTPSVAKGLSLVSSRFAQFLERRSCIRFSPACGDAFDPTIMEAVALQPGEKGKVAGLLQAGYRQGDSLLRPAKVAVGTGPQDAATGEG